MAGYSRFIIRKGTDLERRQTILEEAEPGYVTDYKRLVIGDGVTQGGVTLGSKFIGFTEFLENGSTQINQGAYVGDMVFDTTSNLLYVLSGTGDYKNKRNFIALNSTPVPDNVSLYNNDGKLSIVPNGLNFLYFGDANFGRGLERDPLDNAVVRIKDTAPELTFDGLDRLSISDSGVTNQKLAVMPSNHVKANLSTSANTPSDVNLEKFAAAIKPYLVNDENDTTLGVPVGTIIDFAGIRVPQGYLDCDGSLYAIEDYNTLYNIISTAWGGDGVAYFRVPDLRGYTTVGVGDTNTIINTPYLPTTLGFRSGAIEVPLINDNLAPHVHTVTLSQPLSSDVYKTLLSLDQYTDDSDSKVVVTDTGSGCKGLPHSNVQPSAAVRKLIRAF